MNVRSKLFTVACAVCLIACARPPEPSAARPTVERRADNAPRLSQSQQREHEAAARPERKPGTGARIELTVAPPRDESAESTEITVRITADRALPTSKLRIGTELPSRVDGDAELTLPAMAEGASVTRTLTVHRGQREGSVGTLITASIAVDSVAGSVTEMAVAWAFGPPDPARVLPRTSLELGEEGVGSLGPNDRVVRTPEGDRVHESIVR